MKILKIVLLLLVTVSVKSQELDTEFLESLPDDIRKDIQENNMRKLDGTAEKYSPYIYSSKLTKAETFLKLKNRLEADGTGAENTALDYFDIVVHVFKKDERDYYELERLWADAPVKEINDENY